jgi:RNA polymerase sigma-70 factor, ECF subfamily
MSLTAPAHHPRHAGDEPVRHAVTELLVRVGSGDGAATDELFPIVYDELRVLAQRFLKGESKAQTLQATALVHEAYVRLVGPEQGTWENRAHFFGAAARAIRRILTDHARERDAQKRGGGRRPVSLDEALVVCAGEPAADLLNLNAALEKLAAIDDQKARVVELRFFGGLTVDQAALALGVSPSSVARDWQFARVWLHRELQGQFSRKGRA